MDAVPLPSKFQVVIPQAIRETLHLARGEKLQVLRCSHRVEFIPVRLMKQMRGFLRGMGPTLGREADRLDTGEHFKDLHQARLFPRQPAAF